ncbi:MAG: acyl-CoA dehydrogenase [Deltaproteobacteria bacterium]|nr:acyl-CoA dehydrogenase [Deltaproteobacteria bacterium]
MATYKVDDQDIQFTIFDYLNIGDLCQLDVFKEHNADMYKMVLSEGLKFTLNELDPLYVSGDREECHIKDGKVITPKGFKEAYNKLAENGFMGIDMPTTYGGMGLPVLLNTAMYEYFTGSNTALLLYAGLTRGSSHLIETFGTKELADLFCGRMYSGQWAGTMCLTEPHAGTAVGDLKTTAKKNDDGTYNITGNKIFISSGDHDLTENIVHLVLARVDGDAPGTKGISLFVVPKYWVNADGSLGEANDVNCVNVEHKMGIKGSATCSLNFGENGKCRGFLLGDQSKGMRYMFQMMNEARLLCGMQGLAIAATAYENAVAYAKERTQGGETAIINFPDVRRNLATCRSLVEGMRALLYKAGWHIDQAAHNPDPEQKEYHQNRADLLTPVCKAYCSDMGFRVTEIALQIFGGYGYCSEYPMEQYVRDVKIASIYEGTNGVQALDLLGRKLALKQGQLFREYYEEISNFVAANENNDDIKEDVALLKKAVDTVGQVAMKFAEWGMGGEKNLPLLGATPFLEMVGHTSLSFLLLEQCLVAKDKKDESFYMNKLKTTRFFNRQILSNVQKCAKGILSEDRSAMEIDF